MVLADIEFHNDHALISIPADELTDQLSERLSNDGWELATNGHQDNGTWYIVYVKRI